MADTTTATETTTADLLDEYGNALRGSWGSIDGRSEKQALRHLSAAIRLHGDAPLQPGQVQTLRDHLGVCLDGKGHWTEFCDDGCGPYTRESEDF